MSDLDSAGKAPAHLTELRWPHRNLGYRATPKQARTLASEIVGAFGSDPEVWLAPGGFEVKDEPHGGHSLEALCVPMSRDRFRFVVFGPPPSLARGLAIARREFLIAHETAHTFFYERGAEMRPKRHMLSSDWEEHFCDEFAMAVTERDARQVGLWHSNDLRAGRSLSGATEDAKPVRGGRL